MSTERRASAWRRRPRSLPYRLDRLEERQRQDRAPVVVLTYREDRTEGGRLVVELGPLPQARTLRRGETRR